ncbi:MAG TPA: hypothetical protein VFA04_25775 [Bryobacteraceae bacterium]|nr:hypothetical protein [Bryobacteraceae bacterium]
MPETNHPLPPLRSGIEVVDRRDDFRGAALAGVEAERRFIESKRHMLRTNPWLQPNERARATQAFADMLGPSAGLAPEGPIPGGVGYGFFYNPAFRSSFATGTSLYWEIVCPDLPGGNVTDWLYITATNRSAKGVEALIRYDGQNNFTFGVFDWARGEGDRWRVHQYAELAPYRAVESAHGADYQVVVVMNSTYQDTPGNWVNEVYLLDATTQQWAFLYSFAYPATLQDQTADGVGTWGPIVETFQDAYSGTNPMGALKTQLAARDAAGNWGPWAALTTTQSDPRVDNKGFVQQFVDANYSWTIHS